MATAAAGTGQRDKVSFDNNVTEYVGLMSHGSESQGRDGATEWRYFLAGNRIMWVPDEVHQQMLRINAHIGSEIAITKYKSGRAAATWVVQPIADETAGAAAIRNAETAPASREPAPAQARIAQAPQQPQAAPQAQPFSETLYNCMCAAVRVAQGVETFAQQIGRPIAFETDDIRAMGHTLYIKAMEGK